MARINTWMVAALLGGAMGTGCGGFNTKGSSPVDTVEWGRMVAQWETDCVANPTNANEHRKVLLRFGLGNDFKRETTYFADPSCEQALWKENMQGNAYMTGANQDVDGARDIQFEPKLLQVQALNEAGAAALNAEHMCDVVDWGAGQTHDVLGFNCRGLTITNDTKIKDLVDVRRDTLYFGKRRVTAEGVLDLGRPDEIDRDVIYRQRK